MERTFVTLLSAFFWYAVCTATPVTPKEACLAAQQWIVTKATVRTETATPIMDEAGNTVAYCVPTEEGGTVLTSTDTAFAPILGYTLHGDWSNLSEGHPLRMLLSRMGASQREALKRRSIRARTTSITEMAFAENEAEWVRLLMPVNTLSKSLKGGSEGTICVSWNADWDGKFDHWNQVHHNKYYNPNFGTDLEKKDQHALYNRDCPKVKGTHYLAGVDYPISYSYLANTGCVATAGATIQQFFRYPNGNIGGVPYPCKIVDTEYEVVDKTLKMSFKSRAVTLTTKQATYNWNLLDREWKKDEDPGEAVRNLTNAVSYNTSVSVETEYGCKSTGTDSLSNIGKLANAFKNFGFTNASCFLRGETMPTVEFLNRYVYPSLIANRPVVLSLQGTVVEVDDDNGIEKKVGHAIVAMGFFASGKNRWTHILWGWGGEANGIFNLEEVLKPLDSSGEFDVLTGAISMISAPNVTNAERYVILAGRVVDKEGKGVKRATVTYGNDSTFTKEDGWFALPLPPTGRKGILYATYNMEGDTPLVSEMKTLELTPYTTTYPADDAQKCISSIPTLETLTLQPSKDIEDEISILLDPSGQEKLTPRALTEMIKFVERIKDEQKVNTISKINIKTIASQQQDKSNITLANDIFSIIKPGTASFAYHFEKASSTLTLIFDIDLNISEVNVATAIPQGRMEVSTGASITLELKGGGEQCVFDDAIATTLLVSETLDFKNAKSLPLTFVEVVGRRLTLYFPSNSAPACFLKVRVSGPTR